MAATGGWWWSATISPGAPTPAISRRPCRPRSTIGRGSSRSSAARHRSRPRHHPPRPLPRARRRRAAAARLSMGGRLGLCEPCRTGPQGARRRDAGELLDRSAHVPGRVRRDARRRAIRSRSPTRPGAATSRPRSSSSPATFRAALRARKRWRRSSWSAWSTTCRSAQPHPRRARQGLRLRPVQARLGPVAGAGHARRAWRRLARTASSMACSRSI